VGKAVDPLVFWETCISFPRHAVDDLTETIENGRQITRRTFERNVDRDQLRGYEHSLFYSRFGLQMKNDPLVTYWKGTFRGVRVYWFNHSAIEFIFAPPSFVHDGW